MTQPGTTLWGSWVSLQELDGRAGKNELHRKACAAELWLGFLSLKQVVLLCPTMLCVWLPTGILPLRAQQSLPCTVQAALPAQMAGRYWQPWRACQHLLCAAISSAGPCSSLCTGAQLSDPPCWRPLPTTPEQGLLHT